MIEIPARLDHPLADTVFVLITTLVAVYATSFLLKILRKNIVKKTKSKLDDHILQTIEKPAFRFVGVLGVHLASGTLPLPAQIATRVQHGFFIAQIAILAFVAGQVLKLLADHRLATQKRTPKTPQLFNRIIGAVVYIIAALVVLDYFAIAITPLIATLGVWGVAIGLALQSTLANFFAGLHIISDRPVQIGDFVEIPSENISGFVDDIGRRSTRIKTFANSLVVIPNSKLSESIIVNTNLPQDEMSVYISCGVAYDSDLQIVEDTTKKIAKKILKEIEGGVTDFEPLVRFNEFGDSNINFTIILRTDKFENKFALTHEFIKALHAEFARHDIEISRPVRKIFLHQTDTK